MENNMPNSRFFLHLKLDKFLTPSDPFQNIILENTNSNFYSVVLPINQQLVWKALKFMKYIHKFKCYNGKLLKLEQNPFCFIHFYSSEIPNPEQQMLMETSLVKYLNKYLI